MNDSKDNKKNFIIQELIEIVRLLRSDKGCPWDKKQTHQSLIKYLEQESWEVQDAIQEGALNQELKEELSDVLLQVFMHAEIAKEKKNFDFYDIVIFLRKKLIRRHPHVFDRANVGEDFDIEKEWVKLKEKEQKRKYHPLERIPISASLEYFFKKLIEFEKNNEATGNNFFFILQEKLQFLSTEPNKKKQVGLLGEIFCDLAYWANENKLSWSEALQAQFEKKKKDILQVEKKIKN